MGAKLSWEKKNIANIILFKEYKNIIQGHGVSITPRGKRIKNNQFNIKWFFYRFLKTYYQTTKLTPNIETRLDILLFRTNWFINKEAVIKFIKNGNIKINNHTITSSHFHLKPGYFITVKHLSINNSLMKYYKSTAPNISGSLFTSPNVAGIEGYELWFKKRKNNMIPNISYLEINNNIKGIIILKKPLFKNIPVPFNLHRFYYENEKI